MQITIPKVEVQEALPPAGAWGSAPQQAEREEKMEFYGYFDSIEGDEREYDAAQFAHLLRAGMQNGVTSHAGGGLKVTAPGTGMTTQIGAGGCLINGYLFVLEDDGGGVKSFTHGAAGSADRWDRIVARLDTTTDARKITLEVKEGTPGADPAPPELNRSGNVYELSLTKVKIRAGAESIEAADVVDERGDASVCGYAVPVWLKTLTDFEPTEIEAKANAAVRYNEDQTLTDGQKAQARTNIGATSAEDVDAKVSGSVKATEAQNFTNTQKAQARTNIGAAAAANYTATLTVAGWTGSAAPYTQEATVTGILASDSPFVDVDMSGLTTVDDMAAAQDAFGLILKATAGAGKITFVASDKPETALTVKINNVRQPFSWENVQNDVQIGHGPTNYPIGSQLTVKHSTYGTIVFDVVAHDLHKKPDDPTAHTMTLMMHDCMSNRQIDAPEMLWANTGETALAAGTYNFTLYKGGYSGQTGEDGTYQFTLAKPIPAGGGWTHSQVGTAYSSVSGYKPANIIGAYVTTYDANRNAIETDVAVTVGSGGTSLGTASSAKADCVNTIGTFNSVNRRAYGSNNWQQSAVRQWLNSDAEANEWWQKQTVFDMRANYDSANGFLNGIDADFFSALGAVDITTAKNTVYEVDATGGSYVTRDKVFLASVTEIGLGNNGSIAEGSVLPLYDGATQTDRIKYGIASPTTACYWWLRSPHVQNASSERLITSAGALSSDNSSRGNNAAACCVIY